MFVDDEPIIAECPLEKGSSNKMCYLSFERLLISTGARIHKFDLSQISKFAFKKKLLLLPLIFGGILAPLSLIALINDLLNVWTMLISFMAGSLLIYYGIEGRNTLSIVTNIKEYDFFIDSASKNLRAFLAFVEKIKSQKGPPKFYLEYDHTLLNNDNEIHDFGNGVELKESPYHLSEQKGFVIDPLLTKVQVVYKENSMGQMVPYLVGKIRKDALVVYPSEDTSAS